MAFLDWIIVAGTLVLLAAGVIVARRHSRSVADYLAAGRAAGRYVITLSQGVSEVGAISIVATLEMNYIAAFPLLWWGFTTGVVILLITVSGWVIYRFRETRCLTLAEFFERRYSRRFRIFAGIIAFLSGVINFGIFPAVGARFFIHYCELPATLTIGGATLSSYPVVMIVLLGIALTFVFSGGQVAVIVADFLQGLLANLLFVVISLFLLWQVDWSTIVAGLAQAPAEASMLNPFHTSQAKDFNLGYFLIGVFGVFYGTMSWQGVQAYNASAHTAHEAKMAAVLGNFRWIPRNLLYVVLPIVAYAVLRDAAFVGEAAAVQGVLDGLDNEAVQNQLRVPLTIHQLLPTGLVGAFAAVMLACFISTHDTYLHSWGSIFIQDVVIPLRGRPIGQDRHLSWLRRAVFGVAGFIFLFSLFFRQSDYIFLFFAITGAIFAGGSGAVIIGGLYWRRGTTAAAWAAMITGSTIAVGGIVTHQVVEEFPINGQWFWAIAMAAASLVYVAVSLLSREEPFDLDGMLHRDRPENAGRQSGASARSSSGILEGLRSLRPGPEFTRGDRWIYFAAYGWTVLWVGVFAVGTTINLTREVADASWARFWFWFVMIQAAAAVVVTVWFAIGGIRDLRAMLSRLKTMRRDADDDGWVNR